MVGRIFCSCALSLLLAACASEEPDAAGPETRLALVNAIYFNASWSYEFEESATEDGPFTLPDGGRVTVPMMRQAGQLLYADGADYQAVRLPCEGDMADMLIVLPRLSTS